VVGFTSYKIENDIQFKKNLDEAIKEVGDLRFVMGEISRDIFKTTKQNFILKGSGKYPELSEAYATRKRATKGNLPILVSTGDLRDSVTGRGNSDTIRFIGKQSLLQGTRVPYSKYIQEGTKKMPARKYLFIDDAQSLRFQRMISDYVASKLEVLGNVR
jgi:phage gpG-like protein